MAEEKKRTDQKRKAAEDNFYRQRKGLS